MTQQQGLFGPLDKKDTPGPVRTVSAASASLVRVAFDSGADQLFDYALPDEMVGKLSPGQRLRVPFGRGNHEQLAFCVEFPKKTDVKTVKIIREIVDDTPLLDESLMELARWISHYYCCPLGLALSAMVPAAVKHKVGMKTKKYIRPTEKFHNSSGDINLLTRSQVGRQILEFLKDNSTTDSEIAQETIAEHLTCGPTPFQTLAQAGLIEIVPRRELPHPANIPGVDCTGSQDLTLNPDQQKALTQALQLIDTKEFQSILLHGVTGSGKTEIYMRCIEKVIAKGRQAVVLVPEIALTPQTLSRFLARFKNVAVLHSALTRNQRHQQWRYIAEGGAQVVVGPRSAIFAPCPNLGIIIVDEEHEPSYKQDTAPRYHGRDVAVKLAHIKSIPIILGSATPSLETLYNCNYKQHYHLLSLPRRVLNLPLPEVFMVDMCQEALERKGQHLLSRALEHELTACLSEDKQAILLLNRRGHSSYIFCPSCGFALTCPNCDVSLTYHKSQRDFDLESRSWVMCHYCTHSTQVPSLCAVCGRKLRLIGPGTQQAEEELARKFPDARTLRVDSDSMTRDSYTRVMTDFGAGRIDILMGTQMIGKGLDFPNVTLVGVINADTALSLPDFRSSERTFQLVTQVAGRCGRAEAGSKVIVQSYMPQEPAVALACRHDYKSFAALELEHRKRCGAPPFSRWARLILRDRKLSKVEAAGKELRQVIDEAKSRLGLELQVRGPAPAALARLENYHRWQVILQGREVNAVLRLLGAIRRYILTDSKVLIAVDMDPINLL